MKYITALADLVQGLNAMSDARFYVLIAFGVFAVAAWRINVRIRFLPENWPGKSGACLRLCIGLSVVMLGVAPILAVLACAGVIGK